MEMSNMKLRSLNFEKSKSIKYGINILHKKWWLFIRIHRLLITLLCKYRHFITFYSLKCWVHLLRNQYERMYWRKVANRELFSETCSMILIPTSISVAGSRGKLNAIKYAFLKWVAPFIMASVRPNSSRFFLKACIKNGCSQLINSLLYIADFTYSHVMHPTSNYSNIGKRRPNCSL